MRKEIFIAISFGLIVGLIITIGMYRARTALEDAPPENTTDAVGEQSLTPQATPSTTTGNGLIVREPTDESLSSVATIQVSGSTYPSRTIVILLNERELVGTSDEQGNFSIPVTLSSGPNIVRVRVLNPGQEASENVRTVVYETTTLDLAPAETATPAASPKAKR